MSNQLLRAAGRQVESAPSAECRVYQRHNCDVPTSCLPTSSWGKKDAQWPAVISDVSEGGIRLVLRRRFEPGTGLGVELPGHDGEPYTVLVKVIHVRAASAGTWALGCKFISQLSDDEIRALVNARAPAGKTVSGVVLRLEVAPGQLLTLRIRSLAVPGTWPPCPGKTLTMRVPGSATPVKFGVVGCTQFGNHWKLQGRLLDPAAADLLRALGK